MSKDCSWQGVAGVFSINIGWDCEGCQWITEDGDVLPTVVEAELPKCTEEECAEIAIHFESSGYRESDSYDCPGVFSDVREVTKVIFNGGNLGNKKLSKEASDALEALHQSDIEEVELEYDDREPDYEPDDMDDGDRRYKGGIDD